MFTELEIKAPTGKSFVEFYIDGDRQRIYTGKCIGLQLFPNRVKNLSTKLKMLEKLKYELQRNLSKGWDPREEQQKQEPELTVIQSLTSKLELRKSGKYSASYLRDLESMYQKLTEFLTTAEKNATEISPSRITEFLSQFMSSNSNYMTKRKTLNVLLSTATKSTATKRTTETLHVIYEPEQMRALLKVLQIEAPKLHLMGLLVYGCFLRPHEEARLLQKKNIVGNTVVLSGSENKGKKIRIIPIPDYVMEILTPYYMQCKEPTDYIFTGTGWELNTYYFNTLWGRLKPKLEKMQLLKENQTIYSFRHSAAVNVYNRTKDIYLVQKMLGHSSVTVTLRYLRSLGQVNVEEMREFAPEL